MTGDFEEAQELLHRAFIKACEVCGARKIDAKFNLDTQDLDTKFTFGIPKNAAPPKKPKRPTPASPR